jgi:lipopolysaccharide/colanic/teichoic acid biosynthesis glycosyltransferase
MTLAIPSNNTQLQTQHAEQSQTIMKQMQSTMKTAKPSPVGKRILDVVVCLALLPVLVPVIAMVSLAIMLDSPGPMLFKQKRIGKDGKPFTIYKFRTMYHKFDDSAHREYMKKYIGGGVKQSNGSFKPPIENQITRIGRILRATSLDELPQIINVLRGEMSIVGPRPNVEWEVQAYEAWHRKRLAVKPGITGLAQVSGRSAISFDQLVRYDIEYVNKQSLMLDIQIMVQTVTEVLKRSGAG